MYTTVVQVQLAKYEKDPIKMTEKPQNADSGKEIKEKRKTIKQQKGLPTLSADLKNQIYTYYNKFHRKLLHVYHMFMFKGVEKIKLIIKIQAVIQNFEYQNSNAQARCAKLHIQRGKPPSKLTQSDGNHLI